MLSSGRLSSELQSASSVSFTGSKSSEYIRGLQRDLDRLLDEEFGLPSPSSRSYGGKMGKDPIPNRECFLFTRQILPTNKAKQQLQQAHPTPRDPPKPPPPPQPRFYRPNSSHQYLSATEVSDCSFIESTHGRPTRTSLLRAHKRVSSAPPVNAYEERRIQKQNEEERVEKRPISSAGSITETAHQEMVAKKVDLEGDTVHQFLIGARYNSAHYVDKKAIEKYGVYMSRHHPCQLFTKNDTGKPASPRSRPSSPVEAWNTSRSASTSISPPSPPRPSSPALPGEAAAPATEDFAAASTDSGSLTVRGSRIAAGGPPAPSPRLGAFSAAPRRPATPSFGGLPARRVKSASANPRCAAALPQVVGLSLQIGPGLSPDASPAASARQGVRPRRVLASARLGGRFAPRQGLPASEVNRAFCVRPWRDPKALRGLIRQKAEAAKASREKEAAEQADKPEAGPISIQVEVRPTEVVRCTAVPVVLEDLEAEGRKGKS